MEHSCSVLSPVCDAAFISLRRVTPKSAHSNSSVEQTTLYQANPPAIIALPSPICNMASQTRPAFTHSVISGHGPNILLSVNIYTPPVPSSRRPPNQPKLVLLCSHALGLTKEVWEPTIRHIWRNQQADPQADYISAIYAVDARQHGHSADLNRGSVPQDLHFFDWADSGRDLLEVIAWIQQREREGDADVHIAGVGHSFGAAQMIAAEQIRKGTFHALLLSEPVMFTPDFFELTAGTREPFSENMRQSPFTVNALKRSPAFPSRAAAAEGLRRKQFYKNFDQEAFDLYLDSGFETTDVNGNPAYALKCQPFQEASVFFGSGSTFALYDRIQEVSTPAFLLTGEDSEWAQPIYCADGKQGLIRDVHFTSKLQNGQHFFVPNAGHMVAVEQPQVVAERLFQLLASVPLSSACALQKAGTVPPGGSGIDEEAQLHLTGNVPNPAYAGVGKQNSLSSGGGLQMLCHRSKL
ncbi:Alpha/beta hydrolase family-domain-containing protein [Powellomyces hirtus]|nr:Alpha/beta hydrolase family-domain-containing protein [Powellomyces hirtus]